jgi:hypothetical protein
MLSGRVRFVLAVGLSYLLQAQAGLPADAAHADALRTLQQQPAAAKQPAKPSTIIPSAGETQAINGIADLQPGGAYQSLSGDYLGPCKSTSMTSVCRWLQSRREGLLQRRGGWRWPAGSLSPEQKCSRQKGQHSR